MSGPNFSSAAFSGDHTDLLRPSSCDRAGIIDVIWAMTMYVDHNDYAAALDLFAADGVMRYGELFGGDHAVQPAARFLDYVQTYMPGFDATQHCITNFDIRMTGEDEAVVRSQVRASHWLDGEDWLVCSVYHHRLRRESDQWKIMSMGVRALHESNRALVARAAARVAERAA